jgi:hypothetical protein
VWEERSFYGLNEHNAPLCVRNAVPGVINVCTPLVGQRGLLIMVVTKRLRMTKETTVSLVRVNALARWNKYVVNNLSRCFL